MQNQREREPKANDRKGVYNEREGYAIDGPKAWLRPEGSPDAAAGQAGMPFAVLPHAGFSVQGKEREGKGIATEN